MSHQANPQPDTCAAVVMAPVSRTVANLLHKLQAEIIKEAAERPVPPGACILLPRPSRFTRQSYAEQSGYRTVQCDAGYGAEIYLQTPFVSDPQYSDWLRPGVWYGHEARTDDTGRRWTSTLERNYVCDDFGQLVPVGGAA